MIDEVLRFMQIQRTTFSYLGLAIIVEEAKFNAIQLFFALFLHKKTTLVTFTVLLSEFDIQLKSGTARNPCVNTAQRFEYTSTIIIRRK